MTIWSDAPEAMLRRKALNMAQNVALAAEARERAATARADGHLDEAEMWETEAISRETWAARDEA